MNVPFTSALTALCMFAAPLQAHEFWIDAADYTVPAGTPVVAAFRNGEFFKGSSLSYVPNRSTRFDLVAGGAIFPVPARVGDNPAFDVADLPAGLLTILHETTDQIVTYTDWAMWVRFTEHKDFAYAQADHIDRGLPQDTFRERYRRYAKALVAVGDGAGADARHGLRTEIVAELNPYVDDVTDGLPVQVFLDDAPVRQAQFEMFEKDAQGEVVVTIHRADGEGRAVLPVSAGHEYLIDSVRIYPLEPAAAGDPVWMTSWASLTFAVPDA